MSPFCSTLITTALGRHKSTSPSVLRRFRHLSTAITFPLSNPTFLIWGSNTSVGKTLVSTGLAASSLFSPPPSSFTYIKPIQTGFSSDSDSLFLYNRISRLFHRRKPSFTLHSSNHCLNSSSPSTGSRVLPLYEERKLGEFNGMLRRELVCRTLYAWNEPVSPHLAAQKEGWVVEDSEFVEMLGRCLMNVADSQKGHDVLTIVETAGGVASPGPSGSLQCDLYRYDMDMENSWM